MLKIYIENQLLDLYKDEPIELNSSVANSEDVSKLNTDYTKTFTVPASDRNNYIFKHFYNADIDNTFDARTKKDCRIELDGMPFRTGKMRLEKVAVKNGLASSYTINFWGNLVNFKTLLKEDTINKLPLSGLDHVYNYTNVRDGLINGLYGRDIIYTLLSQRRQFLYNSDDGDDTDTDKLVNIAYNSEDRGIVWSDLKPSVRLMALIEAIEAKYGIAFSRDFFGRNEFKELYLWLNNTEGEAYTEQAVNWTSGNGETFGFRKATDKWEVEEYASYDNMRYRIKITPQPGYENVPYRIIVKNGSTIHQQVDATGTFTTSLTDVPEPPFSLQVFVAAAAMFEYDAYILLRGDHTVFGGHLDRDLDANISTIIDMFTVAPALPEMKVVDFLKGLFNMFKLVAIPDERGNIYVNTIDDYYRQGTVHDITKWVDWEKYDVERAKIFSTINFKYQAPTTILNMQFLKNTGIAYGDELMSLADDEGEPLDGDALELEMPFETIVFERLKDLATNEQVPVQYGLVLNDTLAPANPKGVLYYNNRVSVAASPISVMDNDGDTNRINTTINTPGHTLGLDNPSFSLLWGVEYSTWNAAAVQGTLFKNYWQSYITSIFNIKRRNFKFRAILPAWLLTKLKLNDVLFIKDRYYRVNDFTVNLTTRETSLNLINTFENNFGLFAPSQDKVTLSHLEQTYGLYVSNGAVMNIAKEDTGYGTAWADVHQEGYNLSIFVNANATGETRAMFINVNNGAGRDFQVYLVQNRNETTPTE
ncbi:hypothetical protein OGH69_16665 [Flavobacterium sp. MFBS3-15]|uniref:hypothetical protein n=1 Tax=Flavobacterium sp. MFBS3-15 TaxID=2989816 RepID=UPI002236252C|nr:hypothetical protein [Flavobacterium sp. MFBS3-15]MCW4470606.1 hypothetical protein [Flavobacterium sp. MFBS3-15]